MAYTLIDALHNWRIYLTEMTAINAKYKASDVDLNSRMLAEKVENIALVVQGMWELMEQQGYNRGELMNKIEEIDLRDGKVDRKVLADTVACKDCGHKNKSTRLSCFMCGSVLPVTLI